jgi:hypothetical protein
MMMTETAEWDLAMHIAEDIGLGNSQIAMTFLVTVLPVTYLLLVPTA